MPNRTDWDYLIVTAANAPQAAAYRAQIQLRREIGELPQVRHVLAIPDQDGRRVGSGGSTLECLAEVLRRERQPGDDGSTLNSAEAILRRLRILIVHAGGDSRRLPAYSLAARSSFRFPAIPAPPWDPRCLTGWQRLSSGCPRARPAPVRW